MVILQIEHKVSDFDGWKKAFDDDPVNRKRSGVKGYKICRPVDDPNYVIIDLEFENLEKAELMLAELNKLWGNVEGKIIFSPKTRLINIVETINF